MKINDRLIGLLAIFGGIAIVSGTFGFGVVPGQQFGSAFFPRIVGGALVFNGVLLLATASPASRQWIRPGPVLEGKGALLAVATLAAVVAWVLVSPHLGFIATTALIVLGLVLLAGGHPLPAIATALAATFALYLVFAVLLRVPLPYGVIERVLEAWF